MKLEKRIFTIVLLIANLAIFTLIFVEFRNNDVSSESKVTSSVENDGDQTVDLDENISENETSKLEFTDLGAGALQISVQEVTGNITGFEIDLKLNGITVSDFQPDPNFNVELTKELSVEIARLSFGQFELDIENQGILGVLSFEGEFTDNSISVLSGSSILIDGEEYLLDN